MDTTRKQILLRFLLKVCKVGKKCYAINYIKKSSCVYVCKSF